MPVKRKITTIYIDAHLLNNILNGIKTDISSQNTMKKNLPHYIQQFSSDDKKDRNHGQWFALRDCEVGKFFIKST